MRKLILITMISIVNFFSAQNNAKATSQRNLKNSLAIQGYDPVAYFSNEAVKGDKTILVNHNGAIYNFSNETNKNAFLKDPEKYEPQYGGWCAYAIGDNGKKVKIDPRTFKIVNGKLYLFYNEFGINTLKKWNKEESKLREQADKNWVKLTRKEDEND